MIKTIKFPWLALVLCMISAAAVAQTTEAKLKKLLQGRLGNEQPVESVTKTPYAGLYEVKVGNELVYTDADGKFVLIGHVFDTETSKDLTQAKLDEMNKIKFSDLPLDLAAKSVKGSGKRVIAVFEDPNCGYCKRFRKSLVEVKDLTVYTFMYPVLGEDSLKKVKNLWCTPDRAKAWDDWMLEGKAAPAAAESCSTAAIDKVIELGKKYRVTGTPTIVFADGSRIPGAIDTKTLENKLAQIKTP
jgi:thiol:disulfide interchange protein DsbC